MLTDARNLFLTKVESRLKALYASRITTDIMDVMNQALDTFNLEIFCPELNQTDDYLKEFISAKRVAGRSEKTLEYYQTHIRILLDYCEVPVPNISTSHIRSYFEQRKTDGIQQSSMDSERRVFCTFFNWLLKENLISKNPTHNLEVIKSPKKVKQPYTETDIEKLKRECCRIRDEALVLFLNATGCRVGEVVGLNIADVDIQNTECTVWGKGNKERIVFFDSVTAMILQQYLESRKDDCEALFINVHKERITTRGVQYILRKLGSKAGVEKAHPHKFRRTVATKLSANGMPIQEVAALLGHDKIDTTMKYIHFDKSDMHHSYSQYMGKK